MTCNNQYKRIRIKDIFNSLEEIMARNPNITLESEVIISDLNMGTFKSEVRIYPTKDYRDRKTKVGIFLNPYEKDELLQDIEQEEIKTKQATKSYELETEQPSIQVTEQVQEKAWFDKYLRR